MKKLFNFLQRDNKKKYCKSASEATWEQAIAFYETFVLESQPQLKGQILNLIHSIKENGFDKTLSASISLYFLRVFKTSPHECLFFEWSDGGMSVTKGHSVILECTPIQYSSELEIILNELSNSDA